MITTILNRDVAEVLTVFSISPGSRFLRIDLQERTKQNNANLDKALNILLNSGIIKKEKKLLSLDMEKGKEISSLVIKDYKNLKELPLDVYFSITNLLHSLARIKGIEVYLFGSYSKLVYNEKSDIDIALITDSLKDRKTISKMTGKIESRYGKPIEIHSFGKSFHKNKKDPLVKDILRNGIRLI